MGGEDVDGLSEEEGDDEFGKFEQQTISTDDGDLFFVWVVEVT